MRASSSAELSKTVILSMVMIVRSCASCNLKGGFRAMFKVVSSHSILDGDTLQTALHAFSVLNWSSKKLFFSNFLALLVSGVSETPGMIQCKFT